MGPGAWLPRAERFLRPGRQLLVSPDGCFPLGMGSTLPSWRCCPVAPGLGGLASTKEPGRERTGCSGLWRSSLALGRVGAPTSPSNQEAGLYVCFSSTGGLDLLPHPSLAGPSVLCFRKHLSSCAKSHRGVCHRNSGAPGRPPGTSEAGRGHILLYRFLYTFKTRMCCVPA